jgi:hypothetical protein
VTMDIVMPQEWKTSTVSALFVKYWSSKSDAKISSVFCDGQVAIT